MVTVVAMVVVLLTMLPVEVTVVVSPTIVDGTVEVTVDAIEVDVVSTIKVEVA